MRCRRRQPEATPKTTTSRSKVKQGMTKDDSLEIEVKPGVDDRGICRRSSPEPLDGYFFDAHWGLYFESDDSFRKRIKEHLRYRLESGS